MQKITLLALILLSFWACKKYETAEIQIQNNVHNAMVYDITWGETYFYEQLIPGDKTSSITIEEEEDEWPMSHRVKFFMKANQQRVLLYTKDYYQLNPNDKLLIVISDSTAVESPLQ